MIHEIAILVIAKSHPLPNALALSREYIRHLELQNMIVSGGCL